MGTGFVYVLVIQILLWHVVAYSVAIDQTQIIYRFTLGLHINQQYWTI